MIQRIVTQPWVFFFLISVLGLLSASAVLRVRRERRRKYRAILDRRKARRDEAPRRWQNR